jgi:SAM-dependent methyltransferase
VALLREGVSGHGVLWADLGSGTGAFTLALAELLGPRGILYSVDREAGALREQARALRERFPAVAVHQRVADFTQPLDLPPLDGLVLANSLHFVADKEPVLRRLRRLLRPGGRLILVEYDVDAGNAWVPYPIPYVAWERLARRLGFHSTRRLASRPSRFLREIYSAVSD